jgi:hypothetical protein
MSGGNRISRGPIAEVTAPADNPAGRFSPFNPLAIAAPGRDLSVATVHVDDSIEIRATPYQAILGEFLGLM